MKAAVRELSVSTVKGHCACPFKIELCSLMNNILICLFS